MAVDMLLKIDDIKGESKIEGHKDEIDVLSWSWGMSQSGTMHQGGGGGAGKVSIQDVSITKYVDQASTNMLRACCNGEHFGQAELLVRKAGKEPLDYLKIIMSKVIITSVSTGGSGGEDRLTENVSLNFAQVKVEYLPQGDTGSGEAKSELTWDIEGNVEG